MRSQRQGAAPTLTLLDQHRHRCSLILHQLPCSFPASVHRHLWTATALPHVQLVGQMQQEAAAPIQQVRQVGGTVALRWAGSFGNKVPGSFSAVWGHFIQSHPFRGRQALFLHFAKQAHISAEPADMCLTSQPGRQHTTAAQELNRRTAPLQDQQYPRWVCNVCSSCRTLRSSVT